MLPGEELQGATDTAEVVGGSTVSSESVYDVSGRKLADPFRGDNRAGLSGTSL